jgi:hypothetical protein
VRLPDGRPAIFEEELASEIFKMVDLDGNGKVTVYFSLTFNGF